MADGSQPLSLPNIARQAKNSRGITGIRIFPILAWNALYVIFKQIRCVLSSRMSCFFRNCYCYKIWCTVHWYKCVLSFASSYIYFKEQYIVRVLLNTANKTLSIYGEYIILVCTWYMSKEVLRGCKFACVWGNWWIWIYEKFFFIFFVFVFLLSFFPSLLFYIYLVFLSLF